MASTTLTRVPRHRQSHAHVTMSKLAANRAEFFQLLNELEGHAGQEIDELTLIAEIDAEYPGRTRISTSETRRALRVICK